MRLYAKDTSTVGKVVNNTDILQKILQNKPAPVLPNGLTHLLRAFENDSISLRQLVNIIADFPSIAARLIILANSAWAAPRVPVENLETACVRLGLNLVRNLSISICIESSFQPVTKCTAFKPDYFWCSALLTGEAAVLLASQTAKPDDFNTATLQTAGLLHNLGLLWLAGNLPEPTALALRQAADAAAVISTLQALRGHIGVDYCEVGGLLGRTWNLPDILVSAMEQHSAALYPSAAYPSTILIGYAAELVSAIQHGSMARPDFRSLGSMRFEPGGLDNIYTVLQQKAVKTQELVRTLFLA